MTGRAAPRFLTLWKIRFPIGAIASIGHRISGVLLLVALPLLATALERSLRSPDEYVRFVASLEAPIVAPLMIVACWALTHHLFAGIRHLLMDVGIGSGLPQARTSAAVAIAAGIVAAAVAALWWLA